MNPRNCLFNSIRRTYRAIDTAWTGEIGSCVDFLGVEKSDYLQGGQACNLVPATRCRSRQGKCYSMRPCADFSYQDIQLCVLPVSADSGCDSRIPQFTPTVRIRGCFDTACASRKHPIAHRRSTTMQSWTILLKTPLLIGIIWANHTTYTSPNPVVPASQSSNTSVRGGYATINMRPAWARTASKVRPSRLR